MTSSRLEALRRSLSNLKLDAFIVTHLPHVRWLTGFTGSNGVVLVTKRRQWFLTDGRYNAQAPEEVKGFTILVSPASLFELAAKRKLVRPRSRVGIQSGVLPLASYRNLVKLFPASRFVETSNVVEPLVAVKDEQEIQLIAQAVAITDRVFKRILPLLKPDVRELDIAAEITYLHRTFGADGDAFEPIVASGVRGAFPHARAGGKKLKRGEMVTLDFGCRFQGYHSDLTRTVSIGRSHRELRTIYSIVLDAQRAAIDHASDGVEAKSLDRIARRCIARQGYGKYFSHSLGHGIGLEIHESLRLSSMSRDVLRAGHVVTVEPGVYVPGLGGVRIEDDLVIRERGCEVLNRSPKELMEL